MQPGTIVQVRNRYWVLLPHEDDALYLLRPLTGATDDAIALHRGITDLLAYTLPEERPQAASFPLPRAEDVSDATFRESTYLLWQAARLMLREGAAPLRSLGKISIRPRTYQFVPLLMALRLSPVRLFIADDVGVGKTIEALLIARELWERREIKRMAVLCPPYLCDQWAKELREKFNLEAVVVRSGTVGQLERAKPPLQTIYQHYPIQVISIDYVKSERNRHAFLLDPPDLLIVDEAHGVAQATQKSQQQRYEFLCAAAQDSGRHVILLTATPHSGVEQAFRSLLGLLNPRFAEWDMNDLRESQVRELARHFVQRTRKDIEHYWEGDHCFPEREAVDRTYQLSPAYRALFEKTYDFCAEIVRTGQKLEERKRRVRYWGALALLRCVMSSPAAALAALETRRQALGEPEAEDEIDFRGFIFESDQDRTEDEPPPSSPEGGDRGIAEDERRALRELARLASAIVEKGQDTKLASLLRIVSELLVERYHPIVWCRYVATAEYVANALRSHLASEQSAAQVVCITGRQGDDERRNRIAEIRTEAPRVLVATDCLSEGINLQEKFTAAIHYDLPWNPNRLEQREGRVDRYGQTAPKVKAVRYYGQDNPVDGVVIDVLLNKAREIYRTLGTYVPVPEESETVTEAVLNALFLRGYGRKDSRQLTLSWDVPDAVKLHRRWENDAKRERITRTRFAQRTLKPEEVRRELEAADTVLGDPGAVESFVREATRRVGLPMEKEKATGVFRIVVNPVPPECPEAVCSALPKSKEGAWRVSFLSPTPEGAEYLGRNHPFVAALARFLFEEALIKGGEARAARCGAMITREVTRRTVLLLLRVRYLLEEPSRAPLLLEEVRVLGYQGRASEPRWLADEEALRLLTAATPGSNLDREQKKALLAQELSIYGPESLQKMVEPHIARRAEELAEAHKRVRQAVGERARPLTVRPQWPVDLLGMVVLLPVGGAE